jgi:hypothetical protein
MTAEVGCIPLHWSIFHIELQANSWEALSRTMVHCQRFATSEQLQVPVSSSKVRLYTGSGLSTCLYYQQRPPGLKHIWTCTCQQRLTFPFMNYVRSSNRKDLRGLSSCKISHTDRKRKRKPEASTQTCQQIRNKIQGDNGH